MKMEFFPKTLNSSREWTHLTRDAVGKDPYMTIGFDGEETSDGRLLLRDLLTLQVATRTGHLTRQLERFLLF